MSTTTRRGRGRTVVLATPAAIVPGTSIVLATSRLPDLAAMLDPEGIADSVRKAGPLGLVALFLLLVLQCVVAPLPSEPLMMAAGYVYGPGAGFAISLGGVTTGGIACFALARRFGRPLAVRLVRAERLDALEARLAGRSLAAILLGILALRVFAFGSFDVLSYVCGLLLVPLGWFVAITAIGVVPKVFAFTYLGAVGTRPAWLDGLILVGTFSVILAAPLWVWVSRRRAGRQGGLRADQTSRPAASRESRSSP